MWGTQCHLPETVEEDINQHIERKRGEGYSQPGNCRGRDKWGHQKEVSEQVSDKGGALRSVHLQLTG
jgi:hypothetical protein